MLFRSVLMTGQIMNVMKSTAAVHLLTVQKPKLNNKDEDSIPAAHIEEKVPYPVEKLPITWSNVLLIACLKIRGIHQPFKNH